MNTFFLDFHADLEVKLNAIKKAEPNNLCCYEKSKSAAIKTCHGLKTHLKENPFENMEIEIHFFKNILPKVVSKVHLYSLLYKHENNSIGSPTAKPQKMHRKKMLKQINSYHSEHHHIIMYYKSDKCNLDAIYFLRQFSDYPFVLEECEVLVDKEFSTGYDLIIARYLAYEEYATFLDGKLNMDEFDTKTPTSGEGRCFAKTMQWTGTKTENTELMYSLYLYGCINNNQSKLKEFAEDFSELFQVEIGDYSHTFSEIKNRKNPTLFLDNLRKALIRKIEEQDS